MWPEDMFLRIAAFSAAIFILVAACSPAPAADRYSGLPGVRDPFSLAAGTSSLSTPPSTVTLRATLLAGSRHLGLPRGRLNERNPGVFLTAERGHGSVTVGGYLNSYGKHSIAAFGGWSIAKGDRWDVSLFAGGAYYPGDGRRQLVHIGDVVPIAGIQLRAGHVVVQYAPMIGNGMWGLLSFGVQMPVGGRP